MTSSRSRGGGGGAFWYIYSHRKEGFYFHIALFPEAKLDFVTKLSCIHGNIMRTNQVTGNIIVSTCCRSKRPLILRLRPRGGGGGGGGALQPYHPRKHVLTITYTTTVTHMNFIEGLHCLLFQWQSSWSPRPKTQRWLPLPWQSKQCNPSIHQGSPLL